MAKERRPATWFAAAVALMVAGGVLLVLGALDWRERGDYLRAPVRDTDAVVLRARRTYGRNPERVVHLGVFGEDEPRRVRVERGAAWDAMRRDTLVRVRLWNGAVTRIDVPGAGSLETLSSPVVTSVRQATWGVALLSWGAGLVMYARDLARGFDPVNGRPRPDPPTVPRAVAALVWFPAMFTTIGMEWFQAYSVAGVARTFAVSCAVVAAGGALLVRHGRRHA